MTRGMSSSHPYLRLSRSQWSLWRGSVSSNILFRLVLEAFRHFCRLLGLPASWSQLPPLSFLIFMALRTKVVLLMVCQSIIRVTNSQILKHANKIVDDNDDSCHVVQGQCRLAADETMRNSQHEAQCHPKKTTLYPPCNSSPFAHTGNHQCISLDMAC